MKRSGFKLRATSEGLNHAARLTVPAHRPRRCDTRKGGCGERFTPMRAMQAACSLRCAQAFVDTAKARAAATARAQDARQTRAKLEALQPKQYWLKRAEKAVNRYVRARDFKRGCISCHLPASWPGQWHASHYRSVGAASAMRFNLWNIHKACSVCNNHKSGNIAEYRPRIVALLGADRVEWIASQNSRAEYSVEYLKRMAAVFSRKAARKERANEQSNLSR